MFNKILYSFHLYINNRPVSVYVRSKGESNYYSINTAELNRAIEGSLLFKEMREKGILPMSYEERKEEAEELEKMFRDSEGGE